MSRINPTNRLENVSQRFFEWNGEHGQIKFYDKAKKENVLLKDGMTFILLDELSTIKGWHDPSESGIYSNEVRDTREQTFLVKAFKGGPLAEGLYSAIKDRVGAVGGYFVSSNYIAFREGEKLLIGAIQFHGAALRVWMEFKKESKGELYKQAIKIKGFTEGKKGKIVFRVPNFFLVKLSEDTENEAGKLQEEVQTYLKAYFARRVGERITSAAAEPGEGAQPDARGWHDQEPPEDDERPVSGPLAESPIEDDDVPF